MTFTPLERYEACAELIGRIYLVTPILANMMVLADTTDDTRLYRSCDHLHYTAQQLLTDAELVIGTLERAAG